MKKLFHSANDGSKSATLIIVLALVVLAPIYAEPTMATSAPNTCRSVSIVTIVTSGSLYQVGDVLDPLLGNVCNAVQEDYGFRLSVASVDPSDGHVTAVTIIPGIGYSSPPTNPIRFGGSPTGRGFTANCTFN